MKHIYSSTLNYKKKTGFQLNASIFIIEDFILKQVVKILIHILNTYTQTEAMFLANVTEKKT